MMIAGGLMADFFKNLLNLAITDDANYRMITLQDDITQDEKIAYIFQVALNSLIDKTFMSALMEKIKHTYDVMEFQLSPAQIELLNHLLKYRGQELGFTPAINPDEDLFVLEIDEIPKNYIEDIELQITKAKVQTLVHELFKEDYPIFVNTFWITFAKQLEKVSA